MDNPIIPRDLLLAYKLDELSPEERQTVEERMLRDQEFSDSLEEAEYDLLDDYHAHRLAPEQSDRVRRAFPLDLLQQEDFPYFPLSEVKTMPSPAPITDRPTAGRRGRGHWSWVVAAIAASLVLAISAGRAFRHFRPTPGPNVVSTALRGLPMNASRPAPMDAKTPAQETASTGQSGTHAHAPHAAATSAFLLLTPEVVRGGAEHSVQLPRGVRTLHVQWVVPRRVKGKGFVLRVVSGRSVRATAQQRGPLQYTKGGPVADFDVDASSLRGRPLAWPCVFVILSSRPPGNDLAQYMVYLSVE
jgi:hypothetical protein